MSKQANPTLIGAFVLGAIVLVITGVVVFGSGKLLQDKLAYVLYFDDDLKGLDVGAAVTFRGTRVGTVSDIKVVIDAQGESIRIPVTIEIEEGTVEVTNTTPDTIQSGSLDQMKDREFIQKLIDHRGFRAQLQMQSLVTGKLIVQLDFFPNSPIKLHTGLADSYPEFPTTSSSLSQLAHKLEDIPFKDLVNAALRAIQGFDQLIHSPDVKGLGAETRVLLKDLRALTQDVKRELGPLVSDVDDTIRDTQDLVRHIDGQVNPLSSSLKEMADSARLSLQQTNHTLSTIKGVAGKSVALPYQLSQTLKEFSAASRAIRTLAEYLERHPEALIQGKGDS